MEQNECTNSYLDFLSNSDWTALAVCVAVVAIIVALRQGSKPHRDKIISFKERIEVDILIPLFDKIKVDSNIFKERYSTSRANEYKFNEKYKSEDKLEDYSDLDKCVLKKYFNDNKDYLIHHLDVRSLDPYYNKEERDFLNYIKTRKIINSFLIRELWQDACNSYLRDEISFREPHPTDRLSKPTGVIEKQIIGYRYFYTVSTKTLNEIQEKQNKGLRNKLRRGFLFSKIKQLLS